MTSGRTLVIDAMTAAVGDTWLVSTTGTGLDTLTRPVAIYAYTEAVDRITEPWLDETVTLLIIPRETRPEAQADALDDALHTTLAVLEACDDIVWQTARLTVVDDTMPAWAIELHVYYTITT